MALTQCHYRCNTVLMLSLACSLTAHTHTNTLLHTKAVSLWKLMGCAPRKTRILKSWLGAEHRWCVCVYACVCKRERVTYVSPVVCLFVCLLCVSCPVCFHVYVNDHLHLGLCVCVTKCLSEQHCNNPMCLFYGLSLVSIFNLFSLCVSMFVPVSQAVSLPLLFPTTVRPCVSALHVNGCLFPSYALLA